MQVGSASAGHSSKSLHSNSQSKVCPEDSGIPGNMRHDYGNIYLPLIVIFIYTPIMVFYSVLITYISFMPYINFSNGFFSFFRSCFLSFHPPPALGSSTNMELALGESQLQVRDRDNYLNFYAHYAR